MSNSKLVVHTRLSPNCTKPRKAKIDTITIHCMAGNCSIETCGEIFASPSRQASSHYGIGSDGRIGLYVDEDNRSWCTSSSANDNRAVTIEVANTEAKHPWPVSDKALSALIDLCEDICRRNGIKALLWKGDKNLIGQVDKQNMTVHRWFAAKACPGDYLYNLHGKIAEEVNKRLGVSAPVTPSTPASPAPNNTSNFSAYRVRINVPALNYRKGPGTNHAIAGTIRDRGVYTIAAESEGPGAKKWGKLTSGAGWISLDYCQRI